MEVKLNKEILEYVEQNKEAEGLLTSCKEILIPYILENHKESLYEYIELDNIELELINYFRTVEIKVLDTDRDIKIRSSTFRSIEKELIQPLFNSIKGLNLKYSLRIACYLYIANGTESNFSSCWKEFRISNYDYEAKLICPSLGVY